MVSCIKKNVRFSTEFTTSAVEGFRIIGVVFCLFLSLNAAAANPASFEKFLTGQKAYYQGDYATAEKKFTELASQAVDSGVLYYNLGNVFLKSQKWGEALQYYEKAKRTFPRNRDLQKNRAVVLSHLNQESQGTFADYLLGTFYFWHAYLSREESKILFLGLSVGFWFFLSFRFGRWRRAFDSKIILCILLYAYTAFGTFLKYDAERPGAFGIVLPEEIPVRGNFLKEAEPIFTADQGTKVRILERQSLGGAEKWIKIELAAGQQGWILEDAVGVI